MSASKSARAPVIQDHRSTIDPVNRLAGSDETLSNDDCPDQTSLCVLQPQVPCLIRATPLVDVAVSNDSTSHTMPTTNVRMSDRSRRGRVREHDREIIDQAGTVNAVDHMRAVRDLPRRARGHVNTPLHVIEASMKYHAREFLDMQRMRMRAEQRRLWFIRRFIPPGTVIKNEGDQKRADAEAEQLARSLVSLEMSDREIAMLREHEEALRRNTESLTRKHPLWAFVQASQGLSAEKLASLLVIVGSLDRFATYAKLWKYLGLHVVDGHRPRMSSGQLASHTDCRFEHLPTCSPGCKTNHHPNCVPGGVGTAFSPDGQVWAHKVGDAITHLQSGRGYHYRDIYDRKSAEYLITRSDWPQIRRHESAQRVAVKYLVRDLWRAWRDAFGVRLDDQQRVKT